MRRDLNVGRSERRESNQFSSTSAPSANQNVRTEIGDQGTESFQARAEAGRRVNRTETETELR